MATSKPITLLYFAGVRTAIAHEPESQTIALPTHPFPLSSLREFLTTSVHPNNAELERVLERSAWSVEEEMIDREEEAGVLLKGGETVCAIPPVSGG
ncbi:hypothetical protein RQP46_003980 [Phenoliferia psychrophenolica]